MIEERCSKGHVRTPATTYVRPDGRRQCRMCSGKLLNTAGVDLRGRASQVFTEKELMRLRSLVACMGCGAVPYDSGMVRELKNKDGSTTTMPVVVTDHAEHCTVSTARAKTGRPRSVSKKQREKPPRRRVEACLACAAPLVGPNDKGPVRSYCGPACRTRASRTRKMANRS